MTIENTKATRPSSIGSLSSVRFSCAAPEIFVGICGLIIGEPRVKENIKEWKVVFKDSTGDLLQCWASVDKLEKVDDLPKGWLGEPTPSASLHQRRTRLTEGGGSWLQRPRRQQIVGADVGLRDRRSCPHEHHAGAGRR